MDVARVWEASKTHRGRRPHCGRLHVFAFELGCLKVSGPDREVGIAGPNELAIITEDVW